MLYYSLISVSLPHLWRSHLGFNLFLISNTTIYYPKKEIRIISFSEPKSHSETLFKSLNLLKLNDVIELHILSPVVYQWSQRLLPPCFSEYFNFTSSVHSYSTRQSCNRNLYVYVAIPPIRPTAVEALNFFFQASSFQLLKLKIYCDDHSSLASITAVHI